jgi:8-oxo-dGTP diphosphatase
MPSQAYGRPALTADVVLLALGEAGPAAVLPRTAVLPRVLLIQRGKPPFQGDWALPGGFVNVGESPRHAASRELEEETGIRDVHLEQLRTFGDPGRDPRGHTVTVAYLAVVAASASPQGEAGSDAAQARWWPIGDLPPLAFDHADILTYALQALHSRLSCVCGDPGARVTLPAELSLGDLRSACRAIAKRLEEDT